MFQKIIGLTVLDFENVMEEILITIMIMTTYLFKILRGFAPISVFFFLDKSAPYAQPVKENKLKG